MLLLSTNAVLLLSLSIYISSVLSAAVAESAIVSYTIYWNIWYDGAFIWQIIKLSTIFDYYQINVVDIQKLDTKADNCSII